MAHKEWVSVFFGSPAKPPEHKVVKGLHTEQKTITSRCYGKWPFPEQTDLIFLPSRCILHLLLRSVFNEQMQPQRTPTLSCCVLQQSLYLNTCAAWYHTMEVYPPQLSQGAHRLEPPPSSPCSSWTFQSAPKTITYIQEKDGLSLSSHKHLKAQKVFHYYI